MLQALAARATASQMSRSANNKSELDDKITELETPSRTIPSLVNTVSSGRLYFIFLSEGATDGVTSFFFGQYACERQLAVGRL